MVEIYAKTTYLGISTHFGEVRGDARLWSMACWKAHGRLSVYGVNCTFFAILYYSSGVMSRNVHSSAVSQGVDLFALKFLPGHGPPPATILGVRKLETLSYPMVKTASLYAPSFWHNTGLWRTDGLICRSIFSALLLAVKI